MNLDFTDQLEQAEDRRRSFCFEDNEYSLEARDPYGFWYITNSGEEPLDAKLAGAYTSFVQAEQDIIRFETNRKQAALEAKISEKKSATLKKAEASVLED